MTRKIIPIQSQIVSAGGGGVFIPVGSRLFKVVGEADGKPTYDFIVANYAWDNGGAAAVIYSVKYCGTRNGSPVNLWKEYPYLNTVAASPTGSGDIGTSITPGTGVSLQVYYAQGNVAL